MGVDWSHTFAHGHIWQLYFIQIGWHQYLQKIIINIQRYYQ